MPATTSPHPQLPHPFPPPRPPATTHPRPRCPLRSRVGQVDDPRPVEAQVIDDVAVVGTLGGVGIIDDDEVFGTAGLTLNGGQGTLSEQAGTIACGNQNRDVRLAGDGRGSRQSP